LNFDESVDESVDMDGRRKYRMDNAGNNKDIELETRK
jgi:hypothetical protein